MTEKKTASSAGRRRGGRKPAATDAELKNSGNGPAGAVFDLGDSLTIRDVDGLHERLVAMLTAPGPHRLDGSAVEAVDAAGLQLLAVLTREAEAHALELGWQAVSETLHRAAQRIGLAETLRLDVAAPSA